MTRETLVFLRDMVARITVAVGQPNAAEAVATGQRMLAEIDELLADDTPPPSP